MGYYANGTVTTANITVVVAAAPVGPTGYINPKYVVVGVIYAPPGSSSYVKYSNTNAIGNTTTIAGSFQNDVGYSVSVSGTVATLPAANFINGAVKLTSTESTAYTQGSSSSTTNTLTQTTNVAYQVPGTPTFSPVTSDYDYILLWINPELLVTYTPPNGSNPASLVFNGYAFDPNDPVSGQPPASGPYISGPDIVEVQVGCLDGHFSCPSTLTLTNGIVTSGVLARRWASSANGYTWPAGEGPGLTSADITNILGFDPLVSSNNYTLLGSFPTTTTDGRFTKDGYLPNGPNPIQYAVGSLNDSYSLTQMNTQTVSHGNSHQIKQAFSVQEQFGVNFLGIFQSTTTMTQSETLTWNYSTLSSLTTTNTLTNALSITGPPDPPPAYYGPVQFIAYQDNTFGTFVFVPVN